MQDRVAVMAAVPALRMGWVVALRHAHLRVVQPKNLESWLRGAGNRTVLLVADTADALEAVAGLRRERGDVVVVVLLPHPSTDDQLHGLKAGAAGTGGWDASVAEVVHMLEVGLHGRASLPSEVATCLASEREAAAPVVPLNWVERELLKGLVSGTTVNELAALVGYSERETYRRLHSLYRRLGVLTRTQAVVMATRLGLVANPDYKTTDRTGASGPVLAH